MAKYYDEIPENDSLVEWIKAQQLFHVASAPLNGACEGKCNARLASLLT